jgi:hypothetical protein
MGKPPTPEELLAAVMMLAAEGYVVIDPDEVSDAEALQTLAYARQANRERREEGPSVCKGSDCPRDGDCPEHGRNRPGQGVTD